MTKIKLSAKNDSPVTIVSNAFIDTYMTKAKPLYVKVYIYLLRLMSDSSTTISISSVADVLDETEGDILRSLSYWESVKLLVVSRDDFDHITGLTFINPDKASCQIGSEKVSTNYDQQKNVSQAFENAAPSRPVLSVVKPVTNDIKYVKPQYSDFQIDQLSQLTDVRKALDSVESILQRTLSPKDVQLVLYFFEELEMSADLITFLYSYCNHIGKCTSTYVETVAHNWVEANIKTVEEASATTEAFTNNNRCVATAFAIKRNLVPAELEYIRHWFDELGFSDLLVAEACKRTVINIGKPDFKYTNGTLEKWYKDNVKTLDDVKRHDEIHEEKKQAIDNTKKNTQSLNQGSTTRKINNQFTQYPQRSYSKEDLLALERKLLNR